VRIDESRQDGEPLGLDDLRLGRRLKLPGSPDLRDLPLPHEQVARAIEAGSRIEQPGAAYEDRAGRGPARSLERA